MTFEEWWKHSSPRFAAETGADEWLVEQIKLYADRAWQAAQPQWRPIETIPDDGRLVLVYRPLAHKTNDRPIAVKCALGGTNSGCWSETVPEGSAPTNPTDGACHVTHWMPLPISPEDAL